MEDQPEKRTQCPFRHITEENAAQNIRKQFFMPCNGRDCPFWKQEIDRQPKKQAILFTFCTCPLGTFTISKENTQ
jgi:hypothetical protein